MVTSHYDENLNAFQVEEPDVLFSIFYLFYFPLTTHKDKTKKVNK